jgi:hypothetical protein
MPALIQKELGQTTPVIRQTTFVQTQSAFITHFYGFKTA